VCIPSNEDDGSSSFFLLRRKCSGDIPCELCIKRKRPSECRYDPGPMSNQANVVQPSSAVKEANNSAKVAEQAALPHNPQRKSRKLRKTTNPEEDEVEVEQSLAGYDPSDMDVADGMEQDAASESDFSSYEFDDEKLLPTQQSRYQQPHNYQMAVASTSCAPLLPPIHSTSPRTTKHPGKNYQGWYDNQASTYGYSPPSLQYSSPNSVLQYSMHTSPIDIPTKTLKNWNSEQLTVQSRDRSSSGSSIHSSRPDHRYASQSAPFYPNVSCGSGYPLTPSSMSYAGLYAPVTSSPSDKPSLRHAVPTPPYQYMSHPMQRSVMETHQMPSVPNGWQNSTPSREAAPRPTSSSGVPSMDRMDHSVDYGSRGAMVASFLKSRRASDAMRKDYGAGHKRLASKNAVVDDKADEVQVDAVDQDACVGSAIPQTSVKPNKSVKKVGKKDTAAAGQLNTLVEAVDLAEAEAARPKRYHTRSQAKA
jgi:hypothetical protein